MFFGGDVDACAVSDKGGWLSRQLRLACVVWLFLAAIPGGWMFFSVVVVVHVFSSRRRCVLQCASPPPRCRLELHACLQFSALSVRSTPPPASLRQWGAPSCTRGPNQSGLGGGRTRFSCTPTRTPSLSSGLIPRPQSSSPSRFPSPLPLRPLPSSDSAYAKSRS